MMTLRLASKKNDKLWQTKFQWLNQSEIALLFFEKLEHYAVC